MTRVSDSRWVRYETEGRPEPPALPPVEIPDEPEYKRRYDVVAQAHLEHYREHGVNPWMSQEPELRAWTVNHVLRHVSPGSTVIDAGCGIGLMLGDLHQSYDATGIDISIDYVEFAREQGLNARIGWLERLPFNDGRFDAAVCCDVLEHVRDPEKVVAELHRVVLPGGILVVRVPADYATGVGADSGFGFPVHLHSWNTDALAGLLGGTHLETEMWQDEQVMSVRL